MKKNPAVVETGKIEEIFSSGTKLCFFESQILQNHYSKGCKRTYRRQAWYC